MITVRAATADDVVVWRALRRDGIVHFPSAFMFSLEEHDAISEVSDRKGLATHDRFIAFEDDKPVGIIGLNRHALRRANHRADIGPFYVMPDAQGSGASDALMQTVFSHARAIGVWQMELSVNEDNTRAIAFYKRAGFTQIGRIPNAIIGTDGPEHDLLFAFEVPRDTPTA